MKIKNFLLLIALFFVGCSQPTKNTEPVQEQADSLKNFEYNFEEAEQAAQYLSTLMIKRVNDQYKRKVPTPILDCDPAESQTNMWIMQVKSLIDEHKLTTQQQFLDGKLNYQKCEEQCTCGGYADVIKGIDPKKLNRHDLLIASQLEKKHKKTSDAQDLACARKLTSFCGSSLHTHLKSLE